jgi:hypothetical protein
LSDPSPAVSRQDVSQQPFRKENLHKFQHFPETRALSSFINSEEPAVLAGKFASDAMAGALADESP